MAVDIFACKLFNWATARRREMQIARTDEQCKGRRKYNKGPRKNSGKIDMACTGLQNTGS
jgi:hypothetical protein